MGLAGLGRHDGGGGKENFESLTNLENFWECCVGVVERTTMGTG